MSASTTWNASVNRHAGATLRLAAMVVGNVCGLPDDDECDPEKQRVMALAAKDEHDALVAALEAREAEVKWLRGRRAWHRAVDAASLSDTCKHWLLTRGFGKSGPCNRCIAWLSANPEPTPPEGVEP